jgi:ribonucleoside-diphosphate reductase alpha chain
MAAHISVPTSAIPLPLPSQPNGAATLSVVRRNGTLSAFDPSKISVAISKAFVAVEGTGAAASQRIHATVELLTTQIVATLLRRHNGGQPISIEDVQDQVELALMRSGEHKVARAYVLYREERAQQRRTQQAADPQPAALNFSVKLPNGKTEPLDEKTILETISEACRGLEGVSATDVMSEVRRNVYDGIQLHELGLAQTMAARTLVEKDPSYAFVSARLLLNNLRAEAIGFILPSNALTTQAQIAVTYAEYFPEYVRRAIDTGFLDKEIANFDIAKLAAALRPERDGLFQFLGLQTLYDRYFLQTDGVRFELPQAFFMRVAMGS